MTISSWIVTVALASLAIVTITPTLADSGSSTIPDSSTSTPPAPKASDTGCSNDTLKILHEKARGLEICYMEVVKAYLQNNTNRPIPGNCTSLDDLNKKFTSYQEEAKCFKAIDKLKASFNVFYDLLNFTIADNKFKDFVAVNGTRCLQSVGGKIKNCTLSRTGKDYSNRTSSFFFPVVNMASKSDNPCTEEARIKSCVKTELDGAPTCKQEAKVFFMSLYDHVTSKYCSETGSSTVAPTTADKQTSGIAPITPNFMFAAFAALALL